MRNLKQILLLQGIATTCQPIRKDTYMDFYLLVSLSCCCRNNKLIFCPAPTLWLLLLLLVPHMILVFSRDSSYPVPPYPMGLLRLMQHICRSPIIREARLSFDAAVGRHNSASCSLHTYIYVYSIWRHSARGQRGHPMCVCFHL